MRWLLVLLLSLYFVSRSTAQDDDSVANVAFSNAVRLYQESQNLDEVGKKESAIEILRLFDLIVIAYPSSIPGQRIQSGGQIGPIDLDALRELAGVDPDASAPAVSDQVEAAAKEGLPVITEDKEVLLEWHQRVVPSSRPEKGHDHGEFPSLGQRTHPGIDIISACNQSVTSAWNATVELVIKAGDIEFPKTGNAVILRHSGRWNPAIYSAYFFLGAASAIEGANVIKGESIGQTGALHDSDECGVHFELRNSGPERGPIHPLWHNILGVGNWSDDIEFKEYWKNPETWLTRLSRIESGKDRVPQLLAQNDWVRVYKPGILGQFNKGVRNDLRGQHEDQGLRFLGSLLANRALGGVEITTEHLTIQLNTTGAIKRLFETKDKINLSLRVSVFSLDDPESPLSEVIVPTGMGWKNGSLFRKAGDVLTVTVPADDLMLGDFIRVGFVTDEGMSFLLGSDIPLLVDDSDKFDADWVAEIGEKIVNAINECVVWDQKEGASITFSMSATAGDRLKIEKSGWVDYTGLSRFRVEALSESLVSQLQVCGAINLVGYSSLQLDWIPLELVFGGAKQ